MKHEDSKKRNHDVIDSYLSGETLEQVGKKYAITRERARQIIKQAGIDFKKCGAYAQKIIKKQASADALKKQKDKKCIDIYGCKNDELLSLNDGFIRSKKQSKAHRYLRQKRNAAYRGVVFNLTFPQWVDVWNQSGLYDSRGRGIDGYCMSRRGDSGAYEVGNVYIASVIENSAEGIKVAHSNNKKLNREHRFIGIGRGKGWTLTIGGKYKSQFRGKHIGLFTTKEDAETRYKEVVAEYESMKSKESK